MKRSPACDALCLKWEGYHRRLADDSCTAYPDPGASGIPVTIGFGCVYYPAGTMAAKKYGVRNVKMGDVLTRPEAEELFQKIIDEREELVLSKLTAPVTQAMLDSIVSFYFNVNYHAFPQQLDRINAGKYAEAAAYFDQYINADGGPLQGLINRRNEEEALFRSEGLNPTATPRPQLPEGNLKPYAPAPVPLSFTRTLKVGDQGHGVYELKCALMGLGLLSKQSEVSDVFDDATDVAVRKLQVGLQGGPDGLVGRVTRTHIETLLRNARGANVTDKKPAGFELHMDLRQSGELVVGQLRVCNAAGNVIDTYAASSGAPGYQTLSHIWTRARGPIPNGREYRVDLKKTWRDTKGIEGWAFYISPDPIVGNGGKMRSEIMLHADKNAPGCFDIKETEVMTDRGWIDAREVQLKDKVAQLTLDDTIIYERPSAITREHYKGPMIEVQANKFNALVTPNHRFIQMSRRNSDLSFVEASEIEGRGEFQTPLSSFHDGRKNISENTARLFIAFLADGYHEQGNANKSAFHFRKPRKIERIRKLLKLNAYKFAEYPQADGTTVIRTERLPFEKEIDPCLVHRLSLETKMNMLDEIVHWDGSPSGTTTTGVFISTARRDHADFYQQLAITSGWGASFREFEDPRNAAWSKLYMLNLVKGRRVYRMQWPKHEGSLSVTDVPDYSGTVFCLTTETGTFFVRHRGYTFVTGNSAGCIVLRERYAAFVKLCDDCVAQGIKSLPVEIFYS